MNTVFKRLKGFADMFGDQSAVFSFLETGARKVFANYEYEELRAPILEMTDLFRRSIGTSTDVVQKEMFTFEDIKGRSLSMRPEATAGVIRAYLEAGRDKDQSISRFFTIGPMFRRERPQKGRLRQFHQINCECLGSDSPYIDAELICMLMEFLERAGLQNLQIQMNSLGCRECRGTYIDELKKFLSSRDKDALCEDCQNRVVANPLRVLDCKRESCREIIDDAPRFLDYNCEACQTHFAKTLDLLKLEGLETLVNHKLVRGLDYYCRTTFEVTSEDIGAQTAVAGGGRYDGLARQLGGGDIPGTGFACGMERLALLVEKNLDLNVRPDFFLLCPDAENMDSAFALTQQLRKRNFSGIMNYKEGSFKSLMREAGKTNARICLILGADEIAKDAVTVKNMDDGSQFQIARGELEEKLLAMLSASLNK
ncbi:MAG: histidine--tRNA ligase [Desulfovibrio sp.]|nr:histidine--tRNA ligase [Desulfovibrio sp.]